MPDMQAPCIYLLKEQLHKRRLTDSCLHTLTEVCEIIGNKDHIMGHKVFCYETELNRNFWLRSNVVASVICAGG